MEKADLSVVIPLYREVDSVDPLLDELLPVLEQVGRPWEVLLVDDGSDDGTADRAAARAAADPRVRHVRLSRNCGQSAALALGFHLCRGEVVATLDGDGQCDPADLPALLAELERADMACGWRANRRDSWLRRLSSRTANGVRQWALGGTRLHDVSSPLKVFRRDLLGRLPLFNGVHRFLPVLAERLAGARVVEVPVNHRPRARGTSKYGVWNRLWRGIRDLAGVRWLLARRLPRPEEVLPQRDEPPGVP